MVSKRTFITPDFFSVAPELIGLPLATPTRRAMAMAVDGVLVAILTQSGGVFLGLAAVFVLLRASRTTEKTGYVRSSVRFALRAAAALVLFIAVVQGMRALGRFGEKKINRDEEPSAEAEAASAAENLKLDFGPADATVVASAVFGLTRADEPDEVRANTEKILFAAQRAGASASDMRETRADLVELLGDDASDENVAALDSVIMRIAGPAPAGLAEPDSLKRVISELNQQVSRLDSRNDSLSAQLDRAKENRGVRTYLGGLFDDLGLGFGWAAVYFTGFLAMMRGQTPGKKLAGVRVIRLDGKPIGWWIAFERFGGYAASFSVGLLGFIQILWDRNRQGLHDKACETVVVREGAQRAPRI